MLKAAAHPAHRRCRERHQLSWLRLEQLSVRDPPPPVKTGGGWYVQSPTDRATEFCDTSIENSQGEAVPQAAEQLVEAGVFPSVLKNVLVLPIQPQIVAVMMVVLPKQTIIHEIPEVQVVGRVAWVLVPQMVSQKGEPKRLNVPDGTEPHTGCAHF